MKKLFILLTLLILTGCAKMPEEITLQTEDGVKIHSTFYDAKSDKAVILLHRLGKDKNNWKELAPLLVKSGFSATAIDLRGHGQSTEKFKLNSLTEKDFNNMVLDTKAAKKFLESKGINSIAIIGESIGANTALNYAVTDASIKTLVLLSPGLEYRGIKIENSISEYGERPILIVAAEDDSYSAESSRKLEMLAIGEKKLQMYEGSEHGIALFDVEKDLKDLILNWLKEKL